MNENEHIIKFNAECLWGILTLRPKIVTKNNFYFEYFAGIWKLFSINNDSKPVCHGYFNTFNTAYNESILLANKKG